MARYKTDATQSAGARWWKADRGQAHKVLWDVVRSIHDRTKWMLTKDTLHAELYECPGALTESHRGAGYEAATLPRNVVRKAIDTLTAKVAKERPLPQIFTNRGNWGMQKRARRASEAVEGEFYRMKVFEDLSEQFVTDALCSRAGILKVCEHDGRPHVERVLPWELYVDPIDGRYGKPRNKYHVRTVDAAVLAEMFPAHKKVIRRAKKDDATFDWDTRTVGEPCTVDRIRVVESWHLPSRAGAKDGRHVIAIENADGTLLDEPWTKDYFPFVVLRYKRRRIGYWGMPIAETLEGWQAWQDQLQESVGEAHALAPGGMLVLDIGGDIVDEQVVNNHWRILKKRPGTSVEAITPNPVSPQTYQHMRDTDVDALNDAGVSQMSAHSTKPTGITAAKALMVLDDVETERFAVFVRAYQAAFVELAEKLLDVIRNIAAREGDYKVRYYGRRGGQDLSWAKDFALDRETYNVKVFSTSLLSKRPEARFQQLEQWVNSGWITPEAFFRLSELPDMQREADVMTAGRDLVDDQLQDMLDVDNPDEATDYQSPNPFGDLVYAKQRAQLSYCLAKRERAPDANLALVQRYIEDVAALLNREAAANQNLGAGGAPPAPAPGPGPGMPPPPPPDGGVPAPDPAAMPPAPMPLAPAA